MNTPPDRKPQSQESKTGADPKPKEIAADRLRLKEVFPKPQVLLRTPKQLHDIAGTCVFALDASCLISPFDAGSETLGELEKILKKLTKAKRLIIPAQAMREFINRRSSKIGEIYNDLKNRRTQVVTATPVTTRMIRSMDHHARLHEKMTPLNAAANEYRKELTGLMREVAAWNWSDPVTKIYNATFKPEHIVECDSPTEQLQTDFNRRIEFNLPPVGSDADKPEGIGDTVIWHTMMQIAKRAKLPIVFVSNEKKSDWMQRSGADGLGLRYELLYEFMSETEQDFGICDFAEFLKMNGADEDAVKEAESAVVTEQATGRSIAVPRSKAGVKDFYDLRGLLKSLARSLRFFKIPLDIDEDEDEAFGQDGVPLGHYAIQIEQGLDRLLSHQSVGDGFVGQIKRLREILADMKTALAYIAHCSVTMKGRPDTAREALAQLHPKALTITRWLVSEMTKAINNR